jgi:hypothetical protein
MTRSTVLAAALAVAVAGKARAQTPTDDPAPSDDSDLNVEIEDEAAPPPPAGDPAASDQTPSPILERPRPILPLRYVEVGAQTGVVSRPAASAAASYDAAWLVGGHARLELTRYLGLRMVARHESGDGRSTALDQDLELSRLYMAAIAEPTWAFAPGWSVWLGVGLAWARTTVESSAQTVVRDRVGVFIEVPVGIGIGFELIPDWLRLSASTQLGFSALQSGNLFNSVHGVDSSGMRVTAPPLPEFATSWSAVAGLGVLL